MSELPLATRELETDTRSGMRNQQRGLRRRHHTGERLRRERQHLPARASQQ